MNKQNDRVINTLEVVYKDRFVLHSFFLRIGHWKHLFEEGKYKWIIAKAMNDWIEEDEENTFELVGYLIAATKLGLVLKVKNKDLSFILHRFCQLLNIRITENLESGEIELSGFLNKTDHGTSVQFHNLFETKLPMSQYVVKLITGRKIKLPYHDPRLARLEERIRNYNFCSAIDYSGAISPVETKLLNEEELNRLERITDH